MPAVAIPMIVVGVVFAAASWRWSSSDWAWNHRNAKWRTGVNVSENRATQTAVWKGASVAVGLLLIAGGIAAFWAQ